MRFCDRLLLQEPGGESEQVAFLSSQAHVPSTLEVTAWTDDGIIMGCRHKQTRAEGVLFHPESFLTENGAELMCNFLDLSTSHVV